MKPFVFVALSVTSTAVLALAVGGLVGSLVGSSSFDFDAPSMPQQRVHHVLATGWGPFLNFTFNPSMYVALHMDGVCTDEVTEAPAASFRVCWTGIMLPVNRTGVMTVENMLKRGVRYDAILHMGLENMARGLKLEVAAANYEANDSGGPSRGPAVLGAPFIEPTTAHLGRLAVTANNPGKNPYAAVKAGDHATRDRLLEAAARTSPEALATVRADADAGLLHAWDAAAASSAGAVAGATGGAGAHDTASWPTLNVTDAFSRDAGQYVSKRTLAAAIAAHRRPLRPALRAPPPEVPPHRRAVL